MEEQIVNRVANSGLITLNLDDYIPEYKVKGFDFKPLLFQEMILKEMDFRKFVKENDWSEYQDMNVYIHCSVDVIIPTWAYMIITSKIAPFAKTVISGDKSDLMKHLIGSSLQAMDIDSFRDAKVVIKGCGSIGEKEFAYGRITELLLPFAASIMFGEPCSTVPIYKKPKG